MGESADEAKVTNSHDTGEWYRLEFFKERAEVAVEIAKRKFARTLNGNTLIPIEAFGDDKATKDTLGSGGMNIGFNKRPSRLHNGYSVELLKDGMPFDEIAQDPKVPHIVLKNEIDQWAIRITVPNNLSRDSLASAFGQAFGKAVTKADFTRKQEGAEDGIPLGEITINLSNLINAPDLKLAYTQDGQALMVGEDQLKPKGGARVGGR